MEKLRIFISSTIEDLKKERIAVANAINGQRGWEAIYSESFPASSESPKEVCFKELRDSHIYIGIFKNRYGDIPPNNNPLGRSVTVLEYHKAKKHKRPTLIFIYQDDIRREKKLKKFLEKITDFEKGHFINKYSTINELVELVLKSLNAATIRLCIEAINSKSKTQINNIYELSYYDKIKERFKNE